MGVEVGGGADITQVEAAQAFENNGKLNKEVEVKGTVEPIKFGSHGTDVPVNGAEEAVANSVFPENAVDEWPEQKKVHAFYFVRVRPFEDPKLKTRIEYAEKELQKKNQAFFQLTDAIKAKRSERAQIISQLKPLTTEDKRYRSVIDDRRKEITPLNQALGKLRTNSTNRGERGVVICSSEEELNDYIQSLNYRIQHESNTLVEEKQMLREIKQLEATRERVIANAAEKAKIQESMGQKEAIQDQVKLLGLDLDGVRKDQQTNRAKISHLEDELKIVDKEITTLQGKVDVLKEEKEKAYEVLAELRKQRDDGNAYYYQNRSLLNNAKELAAKKDIAAVSVLCQTEVEKFNTVWSSTKNFRSDYEKRMLVSLDQRQMSRDARMRNPNEKLLVEAPVAPAVSEVVAKPVIKRQKEDPKLSTQHETVPSRKAPKEDVTKLPEPEVTKKVDEDEDNLYTIEKAQESPAIDPAKLKEMKREEEIAKAKLALERKKKMAEKAAAKAALRAQKDAEKKLKEREKKAKKKAGGPAASTPSSEEQTEPEEEVAEPEKPDVNNDEAPLVPKPKERKESTLRHFRRRGKGADSLPKAILKRRKSTPIWMWAAPVAVLVVLLLALGYYYYLL